MAKSVALWRFIPPACRACRAWVWLRSSSAIIHVYVPWWMVQGRSSKHIPPNGEAGKSSTQKVHFNGDMLASGRVLAEKLAIFFGCKKVSSFCQLTLVICLFIGDDKLPRYTGIMVAL